MTISVLGLDIGGANLKAAHSNGSARLRPFPLWKQPAQLPPALAELIQPFPPFNTLAVTMTGELCDCFETRRQGVHAILNAVAELAAGRRIVVWSLDSRFVDLNRARQIPLRIAAGNWLALARFAARYAPAGSALLIDAGSTTTDIIPLHNGKPTPRARSDRHRLQTRELVYTGVRRTPLCALLGKRAAAELFATTLDAYLLLGVLPEDEADLATADGKPATIRAARSRLAHMLCADAQTCPETVLLHLAKWVAVKQAGMVAMALECVAARLPETPATIVVAGSGEFLAQRALDRSALSGAWRVALSEKLGAAVSLAAPAYAVARLALECLSHGDGK
jgi:probable H4MPT-linked C1 transfer pathway protein